MAIVLTRARESTYGARPHGSVGAASAGPRGDRRAPSRSDALGAGGGVRLRLSLWGDGSSTRSRRGVLASGGMHVPRPARGPLRSLWSRRLAGEGTGRRETGRGGTGACRQAKRSGRERRCRPESDRIGCRRRRRRRTPGVLATRPAIGTTYTNAINHIPARRPRAC